MPDRKHPDLGSELSGRVIGASIAVHRTFGPGLDEADYEKALSIELHAMGIEHACQVHLPVHYKDTRLDCGYRMDIVLPGLLLVELKALNQLHPLHEAQLLTYLKLSGIPLSLLINFGALILKDAIVRRALTTHNRRPLRQLQFSPEAKMDNLSCTIIEAASEVKKYLGPGLLRSAYEACLFHELAQRGVKVERHLPANVVHRDQLILSSKQVPMLVENTLMVACLCAEQIEPLHIAKARSLLKASTATTGLCINFHAAHQAGQIRRFSATLQEKI